MIESSIYIGDLKHRNGLRRDFHISVPAETFSTPVITFEDDLICDLTVESISQGFVVHGTITGQYSAQCGYGLVDMTSSINVTVNELFEEHTSRHSETTERSEESLDDAYTFKGDEIDVEQMIRDSVITNLPLSPVCDHGPENCSICSSQIKPFISKELPADKVIGSAQDALANNKDPRWAVLDQLDIDEQE